MRRPADQAKLLFLYLLRSSSAAFATSESSLSAATTPAAPASSAPTSATSAVSAPVPSATATSVSLAATANRVVAAATASTVPTSPPLPHGIITLRLARRDDVPSIQRCNLATLPENYNSNFYVNHMRRWPELALVAEHVPCPSTVVAEDRDDGYCNKWFDISKRRRSRNPFSGQQSSSSYDTTGGVGGGSNGRNGCSQIVGYVLGKVDNMDARHRQQQRTTPWMDSSSSENAFSEPPGAACMGHVTSLAVLRDYRRRGLAAGLMDQLHHQMRQLYRATGVGLHVRISNRAATRLYMDGMGYQVSDVIQGYYQDGEDAYLMYKNLAADMPLSSSRLADDDETHSESVEGLEKRNGQSSNIWKRKSGTGFFSGVGQLRLGLGGGGSGAIGEESSGEDPMRLPRTLIDLRANDSGKSEAAHKSSLDLDTVMSSSFSSSSEIDELSSTYSDEERCDLDGSISTQGYSVVN